MARILVGVFTCHGDVGGGTYEGVWVSLDDEGGVKEGVVLQ